MTRRRTVVLVVAGAVLAAGAALLAAQPRPAPWRIWALIGANGEVLRVREGSQTGMLLDGTWIALGFGSLDGPDLVVREDATPRWAEWLPELGMHRQRPTRWVRVRHLHSSAMFHDGSPEPDLWVEYVLAAPDLDDGRTDDAHAGAWLLGENSLVFGPSEEQAAWSRVEFTADGEVRNGAVRGRWRVRDGALAVLLDGPEQGGTAVFSEGDGAPDWTRVGRATPTPAESRHGFRRYWLLRREE